MQRRCNLVLHSVQALSVPINYLADLMAVMPAPSDVPYWIRLPELEHMCPFDFYMVGLRPSTSVQHSHCTGQCAAAFAALMLAFSLALDYVSSFSTAESAHVPESTVFSRRKLQSDWHSYYTLLKVVPDSPRPDSAGSSGTRLCDRRDHYVHDFSAYRCGTGAATGRSGDPPKMPDRSH